MKPQKAKYGFVGTMGLIVMLGSGTFMAAYACYVVWKLMGGLAFEQSGSMLTTLFAGGMLPYISGWMLFRYGKKVPK